MRIRLCAKPYSAAILPSLPLTQLLPLVLHWHTVSERRASVLSIAVTVTAFTLAHSLTLAAAAFNIVQLPPDWVELAIAITVLLAALNNIRRFIPGPVALMAFAFGLIHGFGFANVLREAALPRESFVWALAGFNIGVELGQQLIVMIALGVLSLLVRLWLRPQWLLRGGSVAVALLAVLWIGERLPI